MMMALAAVLAFASALPDIAITLQARAQQPGELLLVTLTTDAHATDMRVRAFGQLAPVFETAPREWQALVGIDIDQRPGVYSLVAEAQVNGALVSGRHELRIRPKRFPTRRLLVAPAFVDPPPSMAERIARETALMTDVYAHSSLERLWRGPFVRPVSDPANSRFGTRSIFNGKTRSPHAGTDFLSAAGTPVRAPNGGRVALARELYFSGNTVVVDHGLGVFSLLAHLSRIDVKDGQEIAAGERVGLVGATGRVTGPHLHWALRVAAARIDPLSVLELLGEVERSKP